MTEETDLDYILSVRNLNVFTDDTRVLKDINFTLYANKVTAIIGPSGCGKSTLLKTLNGLILDDLGYGNVRVEGLVLYKGDNVYSNFFPKTNQHQINVLRRKISYIAQYPQTFDVTILENIELSLRFWNPHFNRTEINECAERALRRAGLFDEVKDKLQSRALKLSTGQQQKLCIARAIALNPEILLFDEPTAHLDPISGAKIEDYIDELSRDYTILMVTHNMQQAARVSNFSFLMHLGEMIEFDLTSKIFTSPVDRRTQDYITGRYG